MGDDCETRLKDHDFMWNSKRTVRHMKLDVVDALKEWIKENPRGLRFFYDLASCDIFSLGVGI